MVDMQIERFRRLGLPWGDVEKLVPRWKRVVGLGIKVARDWAESDDEDAGGGILLDETKQAAIMEAVEDDSATQIHSPVQTKSFPQGPPASKGPKPREKPFGRSGTGGPATK
ncbi:hypothetical protein ABW21_db0205582 [Orbilia brochopaga]|nr:hypothetical protein ABW21_db0205582 [Drechslerella brochopaga]